MKKIVILFCFMCMWALPCAVASEKKAVQKPAPEPELVIPDKECQYMIVEYKPPVGVDYQSGVDVHGKPVMEADLVPPVIRTPEKYSFDITVDVAKYMGLTVPAGVEGQAKVGTITFEKGQFKFNGNPLEGDAAAALRAICVEQREKAKKPSK